MSVFVLIVLAHITPFILASHAPSPPRQPASEALAPQLSGLGDLTYPVTTRVPRAQALFDQGLRLLYAFNHPEALRAFREAARLDPDLAMAHWGQAMALGPNLNAPMMTENVTAAFEAVKEARAKSPGASDRERALIEALATRYAAVPGSDQGKLNRAYAEAMARVAARFPVDAEVQTFAVDALMNATPWDYWQKNGAPKADTVKAMGVLESVMARDPAHAGALHYYIHLMEASATPERAEAAADRLGSLMPAAGHIVHMPAHIYIRVGRYADAAEANERAIVADEDYLAQCQAQGLYPLSYYPHNLHFLWAAATLEGRSQVAVNAARRVAEKVPHHHAGALAWTADYPVTPLLAYARFGRWRDILTEPRPPEQEPYALGIWRYARGLAFTARGRLAEAEAELDSLRILTRHEAFQTKLKDLPLLSNLQIASRMLEGELRGRQMRHQDAIRLLEEAAAMEDEIPYNEPPVWHHPPRQVLGALLLEAGRAHDASEVYRRDLKRFPENGWSLFGLSRSLEAEGRAAEAAEARRRFEKAWARADITLTSSRRLTSDLPDSRAGVARTPPAPRSIRLPDDLEISYVEQGDPDGPSVVLLHGFTDSWRSYERVLDELPPSLHVFALSQRGHGDSDRPRAGYRPADFSQDLARFTETLGIGPAVVVGHSMGSTIAQRFAIDFPARTRGLVLIGSVTTWRSNAEVQGLWSVVAALEDPVDRQFVRDFQKSTLARPVPEAFLDTVVGESLKVPGRVWRETLDALRSADFSPDLGRIKVPTLIVWGNRETLAPRDEQEALKAAIPNARLLIYDGGGHGLHWEDPRRFAADLAAFVQEVQAVRSGRPGQ